MLYTPEQLNNFTKSQLINIIEQIQQNQTITLKQKIYNLLQQSPLTINQLSEILNTTNKNISSQLTYLRRDNIHISTNSNNYKFLTLHTYPPELNPLLYSNPNFNPADFIQFINQSN